MPSSLNARAKASRKFELAATTPVPTPMIVLLKSASFRIRPSFVKIVYPDGIFPTDYPKAIGIVSMIALSTDGILAKPAHAPIPPSAPRERERERERERRRAEPDDVAPAEEPGSRRAAWDRAVARSQIGQRRDNPAGGADGQDD